MEEKDMRICPVCGKEVERNDMNFTRDCHGITFRLVCYDWKKDMMVNIIAKLMNVLMKIIKEWN